MFHWEIAENVQFDYLIMPRITDASHFFSIILKLEDWSHFVSASQVLDFALICHLFLEKIDILKEYLFWVMILSLKNLDIIRP